MKHLKHKHGFSIIEVTMFLGLSGFLMAGIIIGANISISRQRYNDAINNFTDFLRNAYTDTLNVSNTIDKSGRTTTAIYGKLITFGEKDASNNTGKTVYVYDVVGKAISSAATTSSTVIGMLKNEINANIIKTSGSAGVYSHSFYNMIEYNVPWQGEIQKVNNADGSVNNSLFTGAILIVRSPTTGGIRTYVYEGEIYTFHKAADLQSNEPVNKFKALLDTLQEKRLDMCLDSPDNNLGNRRDFRILERANNTTGVIPVAMDDKYNASTNPDGSRCTGRL